MNSRGVTLSLAIVALLLALQAVVQGIQGSVPGREDRHMPWPDDLVWQVVLVAGVLAVVAIGAGLWLTRGDGSRGSLASGFSPTAPLLVPFFTIAVLVLEYGTELGESADNADLLAAAAAIALAGWIAFAAWRGTHSIPRGAAPELHERLKSEYLALRAAVFAPDGTPDIPAAAVKAHGAAAPLAADGPLPPGRIPGYLLAVGSELGFEPDAPAEHLRSSPRAWNIGSAYLQAQRKLAYVRDSLLAMEDDPAALLGHALALELRLEGSHLDPDTRARLADVLKEARIQLAAKADLPAQARALFTVAATLSSFVSGRQQALVRMQLQQHWLVVVVQVIAALILAIAVLAGANREAIAAAIVFFLVAAGSGILSLLHVRQSVANADLGDDYGLFRIEMARAFTLSGMAGVIAVLLIANLPVLAAVDVFDPPAVSVTPPGTPAPTEDPAPTEAPATEPGEVLPASPVGTPELSFGPVLRSFQVGYAGLVLAQDAPPSTSPDGGEGTAGDEGADDEPVEWRPLRDIFAFSNLGGLLVALLAGWVPERLFRSLTEYGNRLRLDIQSVSRSGV